MNLTDIIAKNREDFEKGIINYLPILDLGQFNEWFPGWMRGDVTCLTGTPAASKTSFSKLITEHSAIPFAINKKRKVKIIRFSLEESNQQYWLSLLSYRLFMDHKIEYNIRDFLAIGRTVEEKHIPLIRESEAKIDRMRPYILFEDNVYNSFGIWKVIRNFALENGTFYLKNKPVTSLNEGWDRYESKDPEEFVLVVIDNLSYVKQQDNEKSQHEAIWNTVEYMRAFVAKKLNYSVLILQHQNADSENQESRKTKSILPTENGLAINKEVARAYLNLIGIANPNKVNTAGVDLAIRDWDGHNLKQWGNFLRTINFLKSRYGETSCHLSLFNAGRSSYFSKIPQKDTQDYKDFVNNLKNYK